jgi:hypothetical protein
MLLFHPIHCMEPRSSKSGGGVDGLVKPILMDLLAIAATGQGKFGEKT